MITKWLSSLRKHRAEDLFRRGYDWAAGSLLMGISHESLETELDFDFNSSAFDHGAQAALNQWFAREVTHKDEMRRMVLDNGNCCCAHG